MTRLALLLIGLSALLATSCLVEERCTGDSECGAREICIGGECREGCRLTRDCSTGESCVASRCVSDAADGDADADADEEVDCAVSCPDGMSAACGYCIDTYEASREDATESSPGEATESAAFSRPGVVPWTSMTREEATAACERADKRLCSHTEWISACRGPADREYPYGDVYQPETCNGIDTYGRGSQALMPTGSFAGCVNDYGAFDLSGNVWEIDAEFPGWVHGGAYNCIDSESLHMCSYNQDFGVEPRANVGFRCCSDGL